MLSQNLIILIGIILVIGIIAYFFYNNDSQINDYKVDVHIEKPEKRVRFSDNVKCNEYNLPSTCSYDSSEVDINDILSDISDGGNFSLEKFGPVQGVNQCDRGGNNLGQTNQNPHGDGTLGTNTIVECNNLENTNDTWDASFGMPLMSAEEKKKYFTQMQKNFGQYTNAINQFTEYQMDQSTIIKTDNTIDPFKPSPQSSSLKGKKISEIYDQQVEGPKFKSKKILKKTNNQTIYANESELNGGHLKGTYLKGNPEFGYNKLGDKYKGADFGNEFNWQDPNWDLNRQVPPDRIRPVIL